MKFKSLPPRTMLLVLILIVWTSIQSINGLSIAVNTTFGLQQAVAYLEQLHANSHDGSDVVFQLASGVHTLTEPLILTRAHSFSGFKIVWQGNDNTVVTTAFKLPPFTLVNSSTNLWRAQLPANLSAFTDLYRNTTALTRARIPNAGSYFVWKQPYCPDFQTNSTCAQLARERLVYNHDDVNPAVSGVPKLASSGYAYPCAACPSGWRKPTSSLWCTTAGLLHATTWPVSTRQLPR